MVLDPITASFREQTLVGSGFNLADTTLRNGYLTTLGALGLDLYVSNNVYHTITLTSTKNIAADDTVIIGSQTFTFKASPSAAGEVDVGTDEATSLANLAAAINQWAWAGSAYIELTQNERAKLKQNLVSATAGTHTVVIVTAWYVAITEGVDSTTAFSMGEHQRLCPLMQKGAIDMVIQKSVATESQRGTSNGVIGEYVTSWTRYGMKLFEEGKQRLVALRIKVA